MRLLAGALAGLALMGLMGGAAQARGNSCDCGAPILAGPSVRYGAPIPKDRLAKWKCEVSGTVVKRTGTTVTIFDRGAAIPLELQDRTRLDGVSSASEIKEGDEIRASFDVRHGSNELTSLTRVG
ncbi:MAG: hypothetical protein QM765_30240 [Myxococcales bacterium]